METVKPVEVKETQQLYFANDRSYGVIYRHTHNLTNDTQHTKITINVSSDERKAKAKDTPINYGVVALSEQGQIICNLNSALISLTDIVSVMSDCAEIIGQTLNDNKDNEL